MTSSSITQAMNELRSANNGYVYANFLAAPVRRCMEKACARGIAVMGLIPNGNGILVKAYFTTKAAAIYCPKFAAPDAA